MKVKYDFDPSEKVGVTNGLADNQKPEPQQPEPQQPEPQKPEPQQPEPQKPEPQKPEPQQPEPQKPEPQKPELPELNDDAFVNYINKKNNTQFKSLDEYQKSLEKEIVKEPEYDENTAKYLRFSKDTGGGFEEWVSLNQDVDKKSDLSIAISKVKKLNEGISLSDSQAAMLLSDELGIDVEDFEELEERDKLKLQVYANKHRKEVKELQSKYNKPLDSEPKDNKTQPSGEKVIVGGKEIDKAVYDQQRKAYLDVRESTVSSIEKDEYSIEVESESGKVNVSASYGYTPEDKQSMLSLTESVDEILPKFMKDGNLDHESFNKGMWWAIPENREKAIKSIISQARSQGVDEILKKEKNIDFTNQTPPQKKEKNDGYGQVGARREEGVSVKYRL